MYTITRAVAEIISELQADSKNWASISGTEQWDAYYGESEAAEKRKLWGYNEQIKPIAAISEIDKVLDLLVQVFDLADSLEQKQIIQK